MTNPGQLTQTEHAAHRTPFVLASLVLDVEYGVFFTEAPEAAHLAKLLNAWRVGYHGIPSILD